MQYYITINGQVIGPMTREQVAAYPVNADTQVSREGGPWAPLYTYPELMELVRGTMNTASAAEVSSKKTLCGIMAILFGGLGVQYFCMGKVAGGFITILLTLVTCGAWEIVTLIQGIMMLCMNDEDFRRKYIDSTSTLPLF